MCHLTYPIPESRLGSGGADKSRGDRNESRERSIPEISQWLAKEVMRALIVKPEPQDLCKYFAHEGPVTGDRCVVTRMGPTCANKMHINRARCLPGGTEITELFDERVPNASQTSPIPFQTVSAGKTWLCKGNGSPACHGPSDREAI